MNGIKKEQLVKSLCRISTSHCGYIGSHCDCKYMKDDHSVDNWGSEATGCPETILAATLINNMTTQEFYAIARRAGITIHYPEESTLDLNQVIAEMQKQRDTKRMGSALQMPTVVAKRKLSKK
jgi:hypothetical protein